MRTDQHVSLHHAPARRTRVRAFTELDRSRAVDDPALAQAFALYDELIGAIESEYADESRGIRRHALREARKLVAAHLKMGQPDIGDTEPGALDAMLRKNGAH